MSKTARISSVIETLQTLPDDFRIGANVAGNITVFTPDAATATHYIDLSDGSLHPLVGDMGAAMHGKGGFVA